jgi:hypothetical protein
MTPGEKLARCAEWTFALEDADPKAAARIENVYIVLGWPYSQCGIAFGTEPEGAQILLLDYLFEDLEKAISKIA